ncbi:MBL fold metallo-hydrolase [Shewanella aestuarii]|uniref:MBL fold metallo-hydrolase n=1 Tax=Shewanella aestuarii TaxID=1028752 RepID=A0A6G9QK02_9GAMM|nr:MBL fold metallo-hydrolase [Shewanella aestuarii]QIR14463.1 MBL fold metallo-hydrolase [Shewanella aestuarii]
MVQSSFKTTLNTSTICGLVLISSTLANVSYADEDRFKNVEINAQQLTDTTYMFIGSGGNIGVSAGSDGILIIDDQFAPLADKISASLNKIQSGVPKYIVNTHYHGDHTGGNAHFGANGTILAHHNVLKRLASDDKTPASALPVITYSDHISIHFNQDTLEVLHLGPGHTDGDSVVYWQKNNVIHMGDLFFKDRFPYIDLKGGGSVIGYRDNVGKIVMKIDDNTQIIPGHGDLATKSELLKFKHMLDDSINWMKANINEGKSLEQIKAAGVPDKYKDWSWAFINADKWIDTLYQDLK